MSRASRRGVADLVVMIVMIVLLLGMGTLAFLAHDKSEQERQYLARLRDLPNRQSAELDATKARYATVCNKIGFKGQAEYSSPDAITRMLKAGGETIAAYYELSASGPDDKDAIKGTKEENRKIGDKTVKIGVAGGVRQNQGKVYDYTDGVTLHGAIGHQDNVIQSLVSAHIPKIRDARVKQREMRDTAAGERARAADAGYAEAASRVESAKGAVQSKQEEVDGKDRELTEALKQEYDAFAKLDDTDRRAAREAAFEKMRAIAVARTRAGDSQFMYRYKADGRRMDDSRDPDGTIFLVDEKSGYVWINVGQRNDVRLNQTFQVLRADASRQSEQNIGEIRVQEVLKGNIARCRVDAVNDPLLYPQAGDVIKNATYTARQYQVWALAGKFGGSYTRHTRQELTDMLLNLGFRVVTEIDGRVDAVITGADWDVDASFARAKEAGLNFEKYTEEEVLYFLGYGGPDPRD